MSPLSLCAGVIMHTAAAGVLVLRRLLSEATDAPCQWRSCSSSCSTAAAAAVILRRALGAMTAPVGLPWPLR
eukprot:SAG25_NODE_201_length_11995_cov_74.743695_9_plen_72_part_00